MIERTKKSMIERAKKGKLVSRDARTGQFLEPATRVQGIEPRRPAKTSDTVAVPVAELRELRAGYQELIAKIDVILEGAGESSPEDAADAAAVRHIREQLAAGAEEIVPAAVVKRLDARESPVRVFREWRGMTQGQLAAAIEVDQSFISKIEAGTKHPNAANLGRLARALRVDADLLLPDEDA
jgi:DNA-binding XRE family transcriptional regulator